MADRLLNDIFGEAYTERDRVASDEYAARWAHLNADNMLGAAFIAGTKFVRNEVEAAAAEGRAAAEARLERYEEALTRLRNAAFWTCQCSSRVDADDESEAVGKASWEEGARWPDPLTHDPRCTVYIAAEALLSASPVPAPTERSE